MEDERKMKLEEENMENIPRFPSSGNLKEFPRSWLQTLLMENKNPKSPASLMNKALVVAPMVDQSDYPFRLLCRNYGANLAYTPMIHSRLFVEKKMYRNKFWDFSTDSKLSKEKPLIAQFCGSNDEKLVEACRLIERDVDAIDLNCGCPQRIAKRGHYGAYLLETPSILLRVVRCLRLELNVPITVKVRTLPTETTNLNESNYLNEFPSNKEDTLNLYRALVEAGANMICIHGRNRHEKGAFTKHANWEIIRDAVMDPLIGGKVPIIANGGIANLKDVQKCLAYTKADGVMSSEAILEYPPLFYETDERISRLKLAREYLDLARLHPPNLGGQGNGIKCVRVHLHRMLHDDLQSNSVIRHDLTYAKTMETLEEILCNLERIHAKTDHQIQDETASWYVRHRNKIKSVSKDTLSLIEQDGDDPAFINIFD